MRNSKGQFIKGKKPWNKGKKGVQTAWNKGIKCSDKTKEKISKAKKKKPTKYWLGKKRLDMIGKNNTNSKKFGREHPCWKEKKANPLYKTIRKIFKYRQWRSDVFTRDNFTCVLCGERCCELNADHYPKRFIDIIDEYKIDTFDKAIDCEELWNINNGRTLCVPCHKKTDTWGRRLK